MNSLLHRVARRAKNDEACQKQVFREIDKVLRTDVRPSESVCLALDGPAPVAKLLLQRKRRETKKRKEGAWDSRKITPGTLFMNQLETSLEFYAARHLQRSAGHSPSLSVILDGSSVPGEGEVKIIRHILNQERWQSGKTYAIVGSDNDILLQAIVARVPGIVVVNADTKTVFSADEFLLAMQGLFPNRDAGRTSMDLAAIILCCGGNDYFPKIRWTSIDSTWRHYKNVARRRPTEYLVDSNGESFNLSFLRELMTSPMNSERESERWRPSNAPVPSNPATLPQKAAHVPSRDAQTARVSQVDAIKNDEDDVSDDDEILADSEDGSDDELVIDYAPVTAIGDEQKCKRYLDSIIWCLDMYVQGKCDDYFHLYSGKSPKPSEFIEFIDEALAAPSDPAFSPACPRSQTEPLDSVVCSALMLGPSCRDLVDPFFFPWIDSNDLTGNPLIAMESIRTSYRAHVASPGAPRFLLLPIFFRHFSRNYSGPRFSPSVPAFIQSHNYPPICERTVATESRRARRTWQQAVAGEVGGLSDVNPGRTASVAQTHQNLEVNEGAQTAGEKGSSSSWQSFSLPSSSSPQGHSPPQPSNRRYEPHGGRPAAMKGFSRSMHSGPQLSSSGRQWHSPPYPTQHFHQPSAPPAGPMHGPHRNSAPQVASAPPTPMYDQTRVTQTDAGRSSFSGRSTRSGHPATAGPPASASSGQEPRLADYIEVVAAPPHEQSRSMGRSGAASGRTWERRAPSSHARDIEPLVLDFNELASEVQPIAQRPALRQQQQQRPEPARDSESVSFAYRNVGDEAGSSGRNGGQRGGRDGGRGYGGRGRGGGRGRANSAQQQGRERTGDPRIDFA
ncbi:XRN 5'-3' exonuclease N-terminus-domain-containing protein [Blyttiomyces helicus]|uniref:XRN 5'-3' exonuclease N-terminus-domain-containing protein n=1 Tax=Blyttiomyces helicus TaxID=388810 RepID=A0A4V1IR82_9FUNG|nr:XRN 5'-3' exonuclease N-terminus-domain-containing protein [Blyttiomyces helicus]|eukprot:RKO89147.1 XRN 5'-3' exonuclease N-terminus-domain-containing protein [Blyttiomyces helicus]